MSISKEELNVLILELLQEGKKLEAIKYCKQVLGFGLKEAKDYVEYMQKYGTAPSTEPTISPSLTNDSRYDSVDEHLIELVRAGSPINAIKYCKEARGLGLKESKMYIEKLCEEQGIQAFGASGKSCLGLILFLVSATLGFGFLFF